MPDPVIQPSEDKKRYQVVQTFNFYGHEIQAGFEFDAASVPRVFWRVVPPCMPWLLRASCGHDWLYRHGIGTREEADRLFLKALLEDGGEEHELLAYIMYEAVRVGGSKAFKADKT